VAANHLRHPALLERDRELDLLRASTEAARRGQGAVLLIEAPAGLGKTGLLQAAADQSAGLIHDVRPAAAIVRDVADQAEAILHSLADLGEVARLETLPRGHYS